MKDRKKHRRSKKLRRLFALECRLLEVAQVLERFHDALIGLHAHSRSANEQLAQLAEAVCALQYKRRRRRPDGPYDHGLN